MSARYDKCKRRKLDGRVLENDRRDITLAVIDTNTWDTESECESFSIRYPDH